MITCTVEFVRADSPFSPFLLFFRKASRVRKNRVGSFSSVISLAPLVEPSLARGGTAVKKGECSNCSALCALEVSLHYILRRSDFPACGEPVFSPLDRLARNLALWTRLLYNSALDQGLNCALHLGDRTNR